MTESLAPRQRLHMILLGVTDVARAAAFYDALGWTRAERSHAGFAVYDLGGLALCLLPRDGLAQDAGVDDTGDSFSGAAHVYVAEQRDDVARILARAVEAGGSLVKPATETDWGVAGYFRDPDGHLFEVDWEEAWPHDSEHRVVV